MGFIEAGATDFWAPRGYVHVIAHLRGTGGPGGTFGFFHAQERRDLHDLVESRPRDPVKGQRELPSGGHETSPLVATGSAR
jgi:uncharacterized protein